MNELTDLVALVAKFERLDDAILDDVRSGNPEKFWEYFEQTLAAKKEVKRYLAELRPLNVDPSLGLRLKKIRDNYGYNIDRLIEVFAKATTITLSQESEEDIEAYDVYHDDEGYFPRKNQVGTIIVNESLPDHFIDHFENLRECYALELFEATIIYCRAVIETGCFEALRRKGAVKIDPKVEDIREFSLKALMRNIKPFVYRQNWDNADSVIKKADEVLHSKRKKVVVTQEEAYDAIKDAFALVEELFAGGHRQARRR